MSYSFSRLREFLVIASVGCSVGNCEIQRERCRAAGEHLKDSPSAQRRLDRRGVSRHHHL